MEDAYIIHGGNKLKGAVSVSGAKNVSLKAIIASLMMSNKVILKNVPRIKDVFELLNLIQNLGGQANFIEKNTVEIDSSGINSNKVDFLYASKIRVSFMMVVPLLYKFGEAYVPNPGGCRIGARPIDRIIKGMESLGINVEYNSKSGYYHLKMKSPPRGEYYFTKSSHTGTETLIILSIFSKEKVLIKNAALEPEIDQLIKFLNQAGADIHRNKTDILVKGVKKLEIKDSFSIVGDRNEAVTYGVLGIASKGNVEIKGIKPELIKAFLDKLRLAGGGVEKKAEDSIRFFYTGELKAVDVETDIHPGFMTDWQSPWAVLMTQAKGRSLIHEKVFEDRFGYADELKKLGAKIKYVDNHLKNPEKYYYFNYFKDKEYKQIIEIYGPTILHNGVLTITDLRAGATLAIAGLIAKGKSVVNGVSILERGYEDFDKKVSMLGGEIKRV